MKYRIQTETTMAFSKLVELPDGSIPLSVKKHNREESSDGTILDTEHWEIVYLMPFEKEEK